MKKLIIIALALNISNVSYAENVDDIPVVVTTSEILTFESMPASIVISEGIATENNCDELQEENGIDYKLEKSRTTDLYECVPVRSQKKVFNHESTKLKGITELSIENIKKLLNPAEKVEISPICSLNADGNVNLDSCICKSDEHADLKILFNKESKKCESDNSSFVYRQNNCSQEWRDVGTLIEFFRLDKKQEDYGARIASCFVESTTALLPENELIYKIIFFSAAKSVLYKTYELPESVENIRFAVTQEEINELILFLENSQENSEEYAKTRIQSMLSDLRDLQSNEVRWLPNVYLLGNE